MFPTDSDMECTTAAGAANLLLATGQQQHTTLLATFPQDLPGLNFLARKIRTEINVLKKVS